MPAVGLAQSKSIESFDIKFSYQHPKLLVILFCCLVAIAKNGLLLSFQEPFRLVAIGPVSDFLDAYNLVDYGGISSG